MIAFRCGSLFNRILEGVTRMTASWCTSKPFTSAAIVASLLLFSACSQMPARAQCCSQSPQQLAIYYGWPSLVNNSNTNTNLATQAFSAYDILVFGDTLEFDTHPDHARTQTI